MTDQQDNGARWSLATCEQFIANNGLAGLRTFGVPSDWQGMKQTRDLVPYSAKKLESLTRKFCSASPEFAPRTKSNARFADQDTRQRLPKRFAGGALFTRQSPPAAFESGPNVLPGFAAWLAQHSEDLDINGRAMLRRAQNAEEAAQ
jgi:hypothetical protein